ncbi:MAG: thiosulfate oxidation carrier complex protein SoxZ [Rhodospirillaceae bacterium]
MSGPHVRIPKQAKAGEIIEVKTLISHPMETGLRKAADGTPIPRKALNRFECRYLDQTVFLGELHPSVSANPYIAFFVRATRSGKLVFAWTDDDGSVIRAEADLDVI